MGALILLLSPQFSAAEDRVCRAECSQARRTCHRAATVSRRVCQNSCNKIVAETLHRAQQVCVDEQLEPRECSKLIHKAIRSATRGCRDSCQDVYSRARQRCQGEREECRAACLPPLDPVCVDECRADMDVCTDDLKGCTDQCRTDTRAGLQACRDGARDRCDPQALRQCIHDVRLDGEMCGEDCYATHPCGVEVRECLMECVIPE